MPVAQPRLAEVIKQAFPNDHYAITDTQWLVSSSGTVIEMTAKLGIFDAKNPNASPTGNAIILTMSSYYGRGPQPVWDWIKAKLEAPPGA